MIVYAPFHMPWNNPGLRSYIVGCDFNVRYLYRNYDVCHALYTASVKHPSGVNGIYHREHSNHGHMPFPFIITRVPSS